MWPIPLSPASCHRLCHLPSPLILALTPTACPHPGRQPLPRLSALTPAVFLRYVPCPRSCRLYAIFGLLPLLQPSHGATSLTLVEFARSGSLSSPCTPAITLEPCPQIGRLLSLRSLAPTAALALNMALSAITSAPLFIQVPCLHPCPVPSPRSPLPSIEPLPIAQGPPAIAPAP